MVGTGVKVTEIAPGLVEIEFLHQRFPNEPERAVAIYAGLDPLTATDIAAAISYVLSQPAHVNVDRIMLWRTRTQPLFSLGIVTSTVIEKVRTFH